MEEEKQRAIADARQAGTEAAIEAPLGGFLADFLFDLLPLDAEGRIRERVVEVFPVQTVGGKGVAEDDVGDVLPLDEHVGLADGVGLGVQLLAIHNQPGVGIQAGEVLARDAQHAAGAGGGIVEAAHHAGLRQSVVVLNEEEIHHEPDDFARSEVLPGGLIGKLGELADEFLEDRAHLRIAHDLGVEVDVGELFRDKVEQAGLRQLVDLRVKLEALEDVPHRRRERLHVGAQILADVVLVAHELFQVERRGVVEELAGFPQEEGLRIQPGGLAFRLLRQDGVFGGLQHAVQTAQDGEREDDFAILRLLVVATKQIGDRPDEGGEVGISHE